MNRETGAVQTLADLWPGQQEFADLMTRERRIFALKAGKIGFTELACAFDGWVAVLGPPNARIHLFSRDAPAAENLLAIVRFGISRLPDWMGPPIVAELSGGDTRQSLKLRAGPDDIRTLVSYAAGPHVGIDQSATHSHVDELAHMPYPEQTWNAIQTTIVPGGSCHVVTRGAGDDNYAAELWAAAQSGRSNLAPFFASWTARPDREARWRETEGASMSAEGWLRFAPESWEDALAGDRTTEYIPLALWDRCDDPNLPELNPGDPTPLVVAVDASVTHDITGVAVVSRHPERRDQAAIRACKVFDPADTGGEIDYDMVERFLRFLCRGGCSNWHPKCMPHPECPECRSGNFFIPGFNVVQIAYDIYQLASMMQRLRRADVAWCKPFPQGTERWIADASLQMLVMRQQIAHPGIQALRDHIGNARAKLSPDDDSKLRMIKKAPTRKIDLAVAASMAVDRVLYLNL